MIKPVKKSIKKNWVNRINSLNPQLKSWEENNLIKNKSNIEGHVTQVMNILEK
jgi:hypothetical protein